MEHQAVYISRQRITSAARNLAFLFAVALTATYCTALAGQKPLSSITVAELNQVIHAGGSDEQIASALNAHQMSERLSSAGMDSLRSGLPGEKSTQALTMLADRSAFLYPPPSEVDPRPTPDAKTTREMLVKVVGYVNTTLRQLPNFMVAKQTSRYEDRPQEDALEATGIVSYSSQPLHFVGRVEATLAYRNHGEVSQETAGHALKQEQLNEGLATVGEFGSVLITTVADALKGKIQWARWEKTPTASLAVFQFTVPEDRSNYRVRFCCISEGFDASGVPHREVFDEHAAYHGEIAFNPEDGSIARIMLRADLPEHGLVDGAGIVVEYGPVEIGGKTFICPLHSISLLQAHTTQQSGAQSRTNYRGSPKTFLNDSKFDSYRRFGSETRILPGE